MTRVKLSSRDRVLFPDDGITKGDLFDYYEAIAPAILPHLRDRPFTMEFTGACSRARAVASPSAER